MRYSYTAFGLAVDANERLPGLTTGPAHADPDVTIHVGALPAKAPDRAATSLYYTSKEQENGTAALHVWRADDGARFRFAYADGTEFVVDRLGIEVWTRWAPESTLDDTATYLLGPVLGFLLRLRGVICLHASAVVIGGRAIALLGPPGAGKSTTAAALGRLGFSVMTDDIVALTNVVSPYVQPGYPQLRLWPESVEFLFGDADALPKLTPTWEKRALDLSRGPQRFESSARPLAAVYLLSEPDDARAGGPLQREMPVEPLGGTRGLVALLANSYAGYLLDGDMRRQELEALVQLQSRVPVRRVVAPVDRMRVPQLCNRIIGDFAAL